MKIMFASNEGEIRPEQSVDYDTSKRPEYVAELVDEFGFSNDTLWNLSTPTLALMLADLAEGCYQDGN